MELEAAVTEHRQRIYALACSLLRDPSEAADVTQGVLVKLWRHADRVARDHLRPWLLRVTRNACIDRVRQRGVAGRLVVEDGERPAAERISASDSRLRMADSELRLHLVQALGRLGASQRAVVILREIHGLSYREIAGRLGCSEDVVRVTLHRARRRLRQELKEVHDALGAR